MALAAERAQDSIWRRRPWQRCASAEWSWRERSKIAQRRTSCAALARRWRSSLRGGSRERVRRASSEAHRAEKASGGFSNPLARGVHAGVRGIRDRLGGLGAGVRAGIAIFLEFGVEASGVGWINGAVGVVHDFGFDFAVVSKTAGLGVRVIGACWQGHPVAPISGLDAGELDRAGLALERDGHIRRIDRLVVRSFFALAQLGVDEPDGLRRSERAAEEKSLGLIAAGNREGVGLAACLHP